MKIIELGQPWADRRFVDERVIPIIGNCYVEGRFPKEIIPELAGAPA